jgi:hypothetical protein
MSPVTFGGDKREGPWRKHIADHVSGRLKEDSVPESHLSAGQSDFFEVSMVFHLQRSGRPKDLDNLAKPILDTLFRYKYKGKINEGVLYKVEDHQVWKLHLEKRLVDNEDETGVSLRIEIFTP